MHSIGIISTLLLLLVWAFCYEMNYREKRKEDDTNETK